MAVVLAVQRWRSYLLGRTYVVKTDQHSLKFLLEQSGLQSFWGIHSRWFTNQGWKIRTYLD